MKISDKHFSVRVGADVQQICQPLFNATNLKFFAYHRIYKTGHAFSLHNYPKWQQHYYLKKQYTSLSLRLNSGQHLWTSNTILSEIMVDAKQLFELDNVFEIVTDCDEYFEVLGFAGASGDNSVIELYLNKQHLLTSFKFYFIEKAQALIHEGTKLSNLLDLNDHFKIDFIEDLLINNDLIERTTNYLQDSTKRYYLEIKENKYLTRQELACARLLIKGLTTKMIAKELNLSCRTVEDYIINLKQKTNQYNKADLINILNNILK